VIDWLTRVDPQHPFLREADRVYTYGESLREVDRRIRREPTVVRPSLDASSVFDCLAAMCGGGGVFVGPGVEASAAEDLQGAAAVLFTSGSSGAPKGARLTLMNLETASRASAEHLGHGSDDVWLLAMGLHHVAGLSIVVRSAYIGGSIRVVSRFTPATAVEAIRADITMVSVAPTMLQQLLDHDSGPYEGLRAVLVGGGPIPNGLLERAVDAGLPVLPTYGMTETFGQVATLKPGGPVAYATHPLPGVELRTDVAGRIAVRSGQVSPGYIGEPDRESDWFTTGDLGEIRSDGTLRVLGRADTVIVTGGENVDPERVENEIRALGIPEVVVVGLPDKVWGSLLVAVYTKGSPTTVEPLLSERLPRFMIPSRWVQVSGIPTTELGKPDRSAAVRLAGGDDR